MTIKELQRSIIDEREKLHALNTELKARQEKAQLRRQEAVANILGHEVSDVQYKNLRAVFNVPLRIFIRADD